MYGKAEYSDRELLKNKEKIHANSSSSLQTAKCTAIARDKLIMKVETALNLWVEDVNRKRVTLFNILVFYNYFNVGNALLCVTFN